MSPLVYSGLIVGVLAMIFFTPFLFAKGVSQLEGELTFGEKLLCSIPIFNTIRAEKKYLGKLGFHFYATVFGIVAVTVRVVQWWYAYNNVTAGLICMGAFWLGALLFVISKCYLVFTVINDAGAVTGFKLLLLAIAYPFGQYYIGAYLSNVIRHMQESEATFKR